MNFMLDLAHKNMDLWKESIKLIKLVYQLADEIPSEEKFNLMSQMRRC